MRLNDYKPTLIAQLRQFIPSEINEARHLVSILNFLKHESEPFARSTLNGHITASAILTDTTYTYIARIWHPTLQIWLQPGGHCEADDPTIADAALRELIEETTISIDKISLVVDVPFDIDVHTIPTRKNEPEHHHYDIRYWFHTDFEHLPQNSNLYQWIPVADLATNNDIYQARYAQKILAWQSPPTP